MVFEIGFSQDYEDLVKDAKLWLEGMKSVNICVVVGFEEEPKYGAHRAMPRRYLQ